MFKGSKIKRLPNAPGVYLFRDKKGQVIYIGKAGSLKHRVSFYFSSQPKDTKTEQLVKKIHHIDFETTPSALEALLLEANLIRRYQPRFNVLEKDDKSFLYLVFTKELFSKPLFLRGYELARSSRRNYRAIFGPFVQAGALRAALEILRRIFPYSLCQPGQKRPCFEYHLKKCPGVCVGKANKDEYEENIRNLIKFFQGRKTEIIKEIKKKMKERAKNKEYEEAAKYRNQIYALEHIQDVSVLKREEAQQEFINLFGRIEGYDISNLGKSYAIGSMAVFYDGKPKKSAYRLFNIKTVKGINDVAMISEVLERRIKHREWEKPNLIIIDGGIGQINTVKKILKKNNWHIPVVGIAKGIMKKNNKIIAGDLDDWELKRIIETHKNLFLQVRDEAHRFALKRVRRRQRIKLKPCIK